MVKVLLPGEALIDQFQDGNRIIKKVGGAPANVACAISKLNLQADFLGTVGNDTNGKLILKTLKEQNLSTRKLFFIQQKTTVANVSLTKSGERTFTFLRGADAYLKFMKEFNEFPYEYQLLHLGSATAMLGHTLWRTYKKLLNIFQNNKKIISFDPNYRVALYQNKEKTFLRRALKIIKKVDIVKLSHEELEKITKEKNIDKALKQIKNLGPKIVLITMGEKGSKIAFQKEILNVSSIKINQVDSTGAGDAFIGYFIGLFCKNQVDLNKIILKEYIKKANICAALTTSKIGGLSSIPTEKQVEQEYKKIFN